MWLDNLRELRIKAGNPSDKVIAEKSGISTRNVARLFAGEIKTPYAETLDHIVKAMGFTLTDIFSETKVVIGDENHVQLVQTHSLNLIPCLKNSIPCRQNMTSLSKKISA